MGYVFRTEERADQDDELQHDEGFEKSHTETAYHDDVHTTGLGAYQAEEYL